MDIDKLFKVGMLILGIVFLLLFYKYSDKNRYQRIEQGGAVAVLDTRKGTLHAYVNGKGWVVVDPVNKVRTFEAEK
jgi:hypothetical protein